MENKDTSWFLDWLRKRNSDLSYVKEIEDLKALNAKLKIKVEKALKELNKEKARCIESEALNLELLEALKKVRGDINWMLNEQKFLNGFVFEYLDKAIAKAEGK